MLEKLVEPQDISQGNPDISVVIPIYNEVESLPHLIEAISSSFSETQLTYEIVCVDDGSKDGSANWLKEDAEKRQDLKTVIFRKNYGQSAAMSAGFDYAKGKVIITMDGDLQNDPADIPLLLAKLEEGYDLVSGWRKNRQDNTVSRLIPSKIANWLIAIVTGV